MLVSVNDLMGLFIHATDGDLGKAHDFYFDDHQWTIRYVVVDANSYIARRKLLVSPVAIPVIAPGLKRFMTALTRAQVKESPVWPGDKIISRQYEKLFADYFKYPYYWCGTSVWGHAQYPSGMQVWAALQAPATEGRSNHQTEKNESRLRGVRSLYEFVIETTEGEIGTVVDCLFDERSWEIRYLVMATGRWLPGRKVLERVLEAGSS